MLLLRLSLVWLVCLPAVLAQSASRPASQPAAAGAAIVAQLRNEAARLGPLVRTPLAQAFLAATAQLPVPDARVVYQRHMSREHLSATAFAALAPDSRPAFDRVSVTAERYYTTLYGSPLAYVRALELAATAGCASVARQRVLDFGYGGIGHLRLLASLGADAVGVDVDSFLAALYAQPGDQGEVPGPDPRGRVTLVHGRWPAEPAARAAVGGGFALILAKNTLKRGYIHPERAADPRRLIELGVRDAEFVAALFQALAPGGLLLIYNLSPAQNPPDQPFLPWADGRCPFARELLEQAGFAVLRYDHEDTPAARAMARALHWDQGPQPMDLERGLFAHVTLLRRPAGK